MKNALGTAGGYADALYSLISKDFDLDGNTNTIYNNFMNLISSSSSGSGSASGSGSSSGK